MICPHIKTTPEVVNYINKFNTDEELLRSGGLPTNMLDRLAFGFSDEDIKTLNPDQLHVKWHDDMDNVKWEQQKSGLSKVAWAKRINLSEPIDVVFEKNKFYIDDGHHRTYAAKILKQPLNVNLDIKMNPIIALAPKLGYDDFHRCLFKQIKNMNLNEQLNRMKSISEDIDSTNFWNQKLGINNIKKNNKPQTDYIRSKSNNDYNQETNPDLEFNEQNLTAILKGKKINWGTEFLCTRILLLKNTDTDKKVRLQFIQLDSPRKNPVSLILTYVWNINNNPQSTFSLKIHNKNILGFDNYINIDNDRVYDAKNIKNNIDNIFFSTGYLQREPSSNDIIKADLYYDKIKDRLEGKREEPPVKKTVEPKKPKERTFKQQQFKPTPEKIKPEKPAVSFDPYSKLIGSPIYVNDQYYFLNNVSNNKKTFNFKNPMSGELLTMHFNTNGKPKITKYDKENDKNVDVTPSESKTIDNFINKIKSIK
jgi:hypothetical protein